MLGALGGLAHHPLQSLMEQGTMSPRSLALGLTKGIVGVVAKPISGAADLVAHTGQGQPQLLFNLLTGAVIPFNQLNRDQQNLLRPNLT